MKLIQYTLKVLLWRAMKNPRDKLLRQRLSALTKAFSTTRKIIRLGHWLEPYEEIDDWLATMPAEQRQVGKVPRSIGAAVLARWLWQGVPPVVGFLNDLFDDVYCLCRINCLPQWMEDPSEIWSLRCWFTGILLDLHGNVREQLVVRRKIAVQQQIVARLRQDSMVVREHASESIDATERALA
ncbi:hypothetical protein SYNPS1DRAFT_25367, partial [Syncephalis pseudoplumigaleata]